MQSLDKVQEVTTKGAPMGEDDNLTPEDVLNQEKADFKAAKKESRQMAKEQRKAERKEFNDKFKSQQHELRQAHRDAKKQLKDQFQSETAGMHVFPQERKEEEAQESEQAFKQERNEAHDQFKQQQRELNADFKTKKQALRQEIREAKANAFGRKIKTPEQEKESLEKKIAKLQAKFMELYGETPEGDSNEEVDKTEGEMINHPFQAVQAN